ncbi:MAG: hypothetical protein Q9159_001141 [Coniocarpon cinnabarinum]
MHFTLVSIALFLTAFAVANPLPEAEPNALADAEPNAMAEAQPVVEARAAQLCDASYGSKKKCENNCIQGTCKKGSGNLGHYICKC